MVAAEASRPIDSPCLIFRSLRWTHDTLEGGGAGLRLRLISFRFVRYPKMRVMDIFNLCLTNNWDLEGGGVDIAFDMLYLVTASVVVYIIV